jgi:hypothetical protein
VLQSLLRQWLLRLAATAAACGGGCCWLLLQGCLQQRQWLLLLATRPLPFGSDCGLRQPH